MSRFISNSEIMKLFEQADSLRLDNNNAKEIKKIQNNIINSLSFLVYSTTKRYRKFPNYEDLVQEGFVGLIKAVKKFDRNRFPNFFVYAEQWIRHTVRRAASKFDVVYSPDYNRVVYAEPSELGKEEEVEETPEDIFFEKERGLTVTKVVNNLSERDREIVQSMFGLDGRDKQTLRELGPTFNLTHERVRQIKNKVIEKLRKNSTLNEIC